MVTLEDDSNKYLKDMSESLKQIAVNTKKEEKKPDLILICAWIAIGIAAMYMIFQTYKMFAH